MSDKSDKHNKNSKRISTNISVDSLFPSDNKSGIKGNKLDIESIFKNTPLNSEPVITFSAATLLERRNKRRLEKLNYYRHMLKYCHKRIEDADEDQGTDIIFSVLESIPECKEYTSRECLEFISVKLREEDFETIILNDTSMFITWKYLELKKEDEKEKEKLEEENNKRNDNDDRKTDTDSKKEKEYEHTNTNENKRIVKEVIINKNIL
jgi:hypothetical protein